MSIYTTMAIKRQQIAKALSQNKPLNQSQQNFYDSRSDSAKAWLQDQAKDLAKQNETKKAGGTYFKSSSPGTYEVIDGKQYKVLSVSRSIEGGGQVIATSSGKVTLKSPGEKTQTFNNQRFSGSFIASESNTIQSAVQQRSSTPTPNQSMSLGGSLMSIEPNFQAASGQQFKVTTTFPSPSKPAMQAGFLQGGIQLFNTVQSKVADSTTRKALPNLTTLQERTTLFEQNPMQYIKENKPNFFYDQPSATLLPSVQARLRTWEQKNADFTIPFPKFLGGDIKPFGSNPTSETGRTIAQTIYSEIREKPLKYPALFGTGAVVRSVAGPALALLPKSGQIAAGVGLTSLYAGSVGTNVYSEYLEGGKQAAVAAATKESLELGAFLSGSSFTTKKPGIPKNPKVSVKSVGDLKIVGESSQNILGQTATRTNALQDSLFKVGKKTIKVNAAQDTYALLGKETGIGFARTRYMIDGSLVKQSTYSAFGLRINPDATSSGVSIAKTGRKFSLSPFQTKEIPTFTYRKDGLVYTVDRPSYLTGSLSKFYKGASSKPTQASIQQITQINPKEGAVRDAYLGTVESITSQNFKKLFGQPTSRIKAEPVLKQLLASKRGQTSITLLKTKPAQTTTTIDKLFTPLVEQRSTISAVKSTLITPTKQSLPFYPVGGSGSLGQSATKQQQSSILIEQQSQQTLPARLPIVAIQPMSAQKSAQSLAQLFDTKSKQGSQSSQAIVQELLPIQRQKTAQAQSTQTISLFPIPDSPRVPFANTPIIKIIEPGQLIAGLIPLGAGGGFGGRIGNKPIDRIIKYQPSLAGIITKTKASKKSKKDVLTGLEIRGF